MQGRNHVALALAGALIIGPPGPDVAAWGALVIGSLAPDLDGGGHIAYAGTSFLPRIVPRPVRDLVDLVGITISRIVQRLLGHRGALHWPIWGVMLWLLGHNLGLAWLAWLGFGYVAHIAGDMLTKSGVPIFGPISQADISLTPMKTGGPIESLFGLGLWTFVAWRLWPMLQSVGGMTYVWNLVKRFSILF
jgi:inner membrane protein